MNTGNKHIDIIKKYQRRIGSKEQASIAARLSFLLSAGIPLLEALIMLQSQTKSTFRKSQFGKVIEDVSGGKYLSESLERMNAGWSTFSLQIIRIGELSGNLRTNLGRLALELKKKKLLRQKIQGALLYPFFITLATLGITMLLVVYIFPKILPIFKSIHHPLPLSTRIFIALSDFSKVYGLYVLLALGAGIVGLIVGYKKSKRFRMYLEYLLFRSPFAGTLFSNYQMALWCRTFGMLLESGLSINKSLVFLSESLGSIAYVESTKKIREAVMAGQELSAALLKQGRLFPEITIHLVAVGERAGNLSSTLGYLGEYFENEVEAATKNISIAVEPLLMVIMGCIVGFIAISIITPIYQITDYLKP